MCYPSRESSIENFLVEMVDIINCHDGSVQELHDPDWLEVVGQPTIPHAQSLRRPPAHVALRPTSGHLVGFTNRDASRRYLQKLQKERERNQEVLAACVDKLPIVIRQMIYPEKQEPPPPGVSGRHSYPKTSQDRYSNDFWQEHLKNWSKNEHMDSSTSERKHSPGSKRSTMIRNSRRRVTSSQTGTGVSRSFEKDIVHYPGFQGSPERQSNNLKYKFGKKKPGDEPQQPSTFRPKGFGMLYDELEFERRYKKVFDAEKRIHFVHSNFVSGQRIFKRNKLPPIGHIPSVHSEASDSQDVFAIMSVQRFNEMEECKSPRAPVSSPREQNRPCMSSYSDSVSQMLSWKTLEFPRKVSASAGYTPDTTKSAESLRSGGVKGVSFNIVSNESNNIPSPNSLEGDSALGTLTEATSPPVNSSEGLELLSGRPVKNMKSAKTFEGTKSRHSCNKSLQDKTENNHIPPETPESEPFNIFVRVDIRPKDPRSNGGGNNEYERSSERRHPSTEDHVTLEDADEESVHKEATNIILYPAIRGINESEAKNNKEKVLPSKNNSTANQNGCGFQKVENSKENIINSSAKLFKEQLMQTVDNSDTKVNNITYNSVSSLSTYVIKGTPKATV